MKKRAIVYIILGSVLLIFGLMSIYDNLIGLGVVLIGAAGALTFPGFFILFSNDEEKHKKHPSQKLSPSNPPIGSTMAVIDITFSRIETAISTDSIYICQKATAQLDYFFYLFFIRTLQAIKETLSNLKLPTL